MEEYDSIIPGGEEAYDEVNDLISETDWSQDVKLLTAETKVKMYAYFGHEVKLKGAPTTQKEEAKKEVKEEAKEEVKQEED